jgi:hypothetical protein
MQRLEQWEGKPPPADPAKIAPDVLAAALEDMRRILDREPQLGDFGFGVYDERGKTAAERQTELEHQRTLISEPRSLAALIAARSWLRQFRKIKALNNRGTSYGLKHVAEHDIGYLTNGVFIAAALAEGFDVKRENRSPNAVLNISSAAWSQRS